MTSCVRHSHKARQDLLSIWAYIAEDNPTAADHLLDSLDDACAKLAAYPKMGQARTDIAPTLRYFPVGNYLILYQESNDGIEVIRVLHTARDMAAVFHDG